MRRWVTATGPEPRWTTSPSRNGSSSPSKPSANFASVTQAYDTLDPHGQRHFDYLGGPNPYCWGVWTYTNSYVMPQCELFATSADTAEEIWFDMVLIGPALTPGL